MNAFLHNTLRLNHPLYTDYIKPLSAGARLVAVEVTKCVAINCFLELSILKLFGQAKKVRLAYSIVRTHVVIAPRGEELLFRGLVQHGIGLCQRKWYDFSQKRRISTQELKSQKYIRIALTAALFSLSHLNHRASLNSNLKVVTLLASTYIAGLNYGCLAERYQTLSLPILGHAINNMIVQSALVDRISPLMTYSLVVLNQIAILAINSR